MVPLVGGPERIDRRPDLSRHRLEPSFILRLAENIPIVQNKGLRNLASTECPVTLFPLTTDLHLAATVGQGTASPCSRLHRWQLDGLESTTR
jgi:hypothetical protein